MEWDFSPAFNNFDLLLLGLVNTLKVTGVALGFGIPLGLMLALSRLSQFRPLSIKFLNLKLNYFPIYHPERLIFHNAIILS